MDNITTTLLLNAILRVKYLHYHATHGSQFAVGVHAIWCLPVSPKPVSPKFGFRVRVRVRGWGLGLRLGLAFRRIGFRRIGTEPAILRYKRIDV